RNDDYWREGRPYLDGIEFRVIPDPTERAEALRRGDVDLIHTVRDEDVLQFRSDTEVNLIEDDSGEETFAMLNTEAAPFDDPLVRQALAMATDQQRLVDVLGSGIVREATSLFPEGLPWHPDDPNYPEYDPEQAAALVAQSEQLTGQPVRFTFTTTPTTDNLASAQLLEAMWEEVGMEVEVATVSQSELINQAISGDFQAVNFRLFGSPDPDGEFVWLHSSHSEPVGEISLNFSRMENPVVDAALEAGRGTDDPEVRERSYQTLAQEVNTTLPFVWLQQTLWALAARSSVQGMDDAANGGIGALGAKPWLADPGSPRSRAGPSRRRRTASGSGAAILCRCSPTTSTTRCPRRASPSGPSSPVMRRASSWTTAPAWRPGTGTCGTSRRWWAPVTSWCSTPRGCCRPGCSCGSRRAARPRCCSWRNVPTAR
ncbi:hypothetical protein B7486_57740, partial [cyanobacterium TDX16]